MFDQSKPNAWLFDCALAICKVVRYLFADPRDCVFKIWANAVVVRGEDRDDNVTVWALEYANVVTDVRQEVAGLVRHTKACHVLGQTRAVNLAAQVRDRLTALVCPS